MGRRLKMVTMDILLRLFYTFGTISIRIAAGFFVEIQKLILKFIWT